MSALLALSNCKNDHPLVSLIYTTWLQVKDCGKNLNFVWCPSHCGITGNELVDIAARNPTTNITLKTCTSYDFRPVLSSIIQKHWQISWDNVINNKLKRVKPLIENWETSNRNSRYEEIVITRLRIGHTRLTHDHLFKRDPRPTCGCGDTLTVDHIFNCPTHLQSRSSLPSPPALDNNPANIDSTLMYMKAIGIYTKI
ncbi:hypothetical protein M8J77_026236 [Diaphorina citri]|nr:hypothetical protein M8J77_026236 [Diaphorina citri]